MSKRSIEIAVGLFMVLALVAFVFVALHVSGLQEITTTQGYKIKAAFDNIGNLRVRSRVTISGVQIGKVIDIDLEQENFRSIVTMLIDDKFHNIPSDSTASVHTAGLIGENYIAILPGADQPPDILKDQDLIEDTQGALILEKLIQKLLASKLAE